MDISSIYVCIPRCVMNPFCQCSRFKERQLHVKIKCWRCFLLSATEDCRKTATRTFTSFLFSGLFACLLRSWRHEIDPNPSLLYEVETMGAISSFLREFKSVSASPKHILTPKELFQLWTALFSLKVFQYAKTTRVES